LSHKGLRGNHGIPPKTASQPAHGVDGKQVFSDSLRHPLQIAKNWQPIVSIGHHASPVPHTVRLCVKSERSVTSGLSGEPGIGKSRISAELEGHLRGEPHIRLRYFCSPYHQDSALYPFIDQLGRTAGFSRDDSPTVRLEKLAALLSRTTPPAEDVAFLADLLSLPQHATTRARPMQCVERDAYSHAFLPVRFD
jgi:hypothetical protein